jgi:hypothetical protein
MGNTINNLVEVGKIAGRLKDAANDKGINRKANLAYIKGLISPRSEMEKLSGNKIPRTLRAQMAKTEAQKALTKAAIIREGWNIGLEKLSKVGEDQTEDTQYMDTTNDTNNTPNQPKKINTNVRNFSLLSHKDFYVIAGNFKYDKVSKLYGPFKSEDEAKRFLMERAKEFDDIILMNTSKEVADKLLKTYTYDYKLRRAEYLKNIKAKQLVEAEYAKWSETPEGKEAIKVSKSGMIRGAILGAVIGGTLGAGLGYISRLLINEDPYELRYLTKGNTKAATIGGGVVGALSGALVGSKLGSEDSLEKSKAANDLKKKIEYLSGKL